MIPFNLPPPKGESEAPKWNGESWILGDKKVLVLEYSTNFSGWSDDLTKLHEDSVGEVHPIDLASRRDATEQLQQHLQNNDAPIILEIGCSSGFLIGELRQKHPKALIIGADVVQEPLNILAKSMPEVPFMRFDLLECPLPDQSVDAVVMLNVLEHIEDDVSALNNVFKILKKNGILVIEVPASPMLYDSYDIKLKHFRRYSTKDLQAKLIGVGFKIVRRSHLGFIVFPAFAAVKLIGKLLKSKNDKVVEQRAANTSKNPFVRLALALEYRILRRYKLPFGIRTLITAKKINRESLPL